MPTVTPQATSAAARSLPVTLAAAPPLHPLALKRAVLDRQLTALDINGSPRAQAAATAIRAIPAFGGEADDVKVPQRQIAGFSDGERPKIHVIVVMFEL